jgi:hypothetical protein
MARRWLYRLEARYPRAVSPARVEDALAIGEDIRFSYPVGKHIRFTCAPTRRCVLSRRSTRRPAPRRANPLFAGRKGPSLCDLLLSRFGSSRSVSRRRLPRPARRREVREPVLARPVARCGSAEACRNASAKGTRGRSESRVRALLRSGRAAADVPRGARRCVCVQTLFHDRRDHRPPTAGRSEDGCVDPATLAAGDRRARADSRQESAPGLCLRRRRGPTAGDSTPPMSAC